MNIPISHELIAICQEIVEKNYTQNDWARIESSDMFQSSQFCGGFDADEKEFCFSFFPDDSREFWFQFDLGIATQIAGGVVINLIGKQAE